MLTRTLLAFTTLGAEWVLWLLVLLSVASVGIMVERALFFARRRLPDPDGLSRMLLEGDLAGARAAVEGREGMEAEVVRAALDNAARGSGAVTEVVNAHLERARLEYERRLAFLGTLGNNAPFIGLFGTVLGIIRAFADLAAHPGAAGAGSVMAGISEALVATAVGIMVAIPAVVAFNGYQRWLKVIVTRSEAIGHALRTHLERDDVREPALARARSASAA
jgi:biopolymer transport protein ExbB